MTRKEALEALLVKVETGEFPSKWRLLNEAGLAHNSYGLHLPGYASDAYSGSLDAAKALHEAVLPLWVVSSFSIWGPDSSIEIYGTHTENGEGWWHTHGDGREIGRSESPARAWLIAIIKALIAECEE